MANPSLPILRLLYAGTHGDDGRVGAAWQELWEAAVATAVPLLAPDVAALERDCRLAAQTALAERAAAGPVYAHRRVRPPAPTPAELAAAGPMAFWAQWSETTRAFVLGIAASIVIVLLYQAMVPGAHRPARDGVSHRETLPTTLAPVVPRSQPGAAWTSHRQSRAWARMQARLASGTASSTLGAGASVTSRVGAP